MPLWSAYTLTHAEWGASRKIKRSVCRCRIYRVIQISLESWRCGETAHMNGTMQQLNKGSLGGCARVVRNGIVLYIRKEQGSMKLCLGMGEESAETLWT